MYLKGFDNQDIYTKRSGLLRADSKEEFTNRGGGGNRIERREKWPKKGWEEGEIGGKSREEGEKEKLGVGGIELDGPG